MKRKLKIYYYTLYKNVLEKNLISQEFMYNSNQVFKNLGVISLNKRVKDKRGNIKRKE